MGVGGRIGGEDSTAAGGGVDLSFGERFFDGWTRVKVGSGSLGWAVDAEEHDGGTFELIGSGGGGGREEGVEDMSWHSWWDRKKERRKADKSGQRRDGQKGRFSRKGSLNCGADRHLCLLSCIRLVGCFNGNTNKTLYWSAVCAASESGGMSLHAHSIVTGSADLPTKTTWEKGKGEPAHSQHNRRRHATQS